MDYSTSGGRRGGGKEPRDKTRTEHPRGKMPGGASRKAAARPDKAELLARMKQAAQDKAGPADPDA